MNQENNDCVKNPNLTSQADGGEVHISLDQNDEKLRKRNVNFPEDINKLN